MKSFLDKSGGISQSKSVHSKISNLLINMANIKSMIVLAFLSLGMVSITPASGQVTRSVVDFWLTFAELLTEDVITRLSSVQLPAIQIPNIQLPQIPNIQIPHIQIPNIQIPSIPDIPAIPIPYVHSHGPDYAPHIHFNTIPHSHTGPVVPPVTANPDGCKPDKVKIIVVEDCDEKHKSSESCEDSDEVDIVVPYTKRGRYHHHKKSHH